MSVTVPRAALSKALEQIYDLRLSKRYEEAVTSFNGSFFTIEYRGVAIGAPAQGHWRGRIRIPAKFIFMLAKMLPPGDPLTIACDGTRFSVGQSSISIIAQDHAPGALHVSVNKSDFLEVARVFKKFYRPSGSSNVIFTLANRQLKIEYYGGGCELNCDHSGQLTAELTAAAFSRVVTAHAGDKDFSGSIVLTFNPGLQEFGTPECDVKMKFHQFSI